MSQESREQNENHSALVESKLENPQPDGNQRGPRRKFEQISTRMIWLAFIITLIFFTDRSIPPYDPVIGGRPVSQSPISSALLWGSAYGQNALAVYLGGDPNNYPLGQVLHRAHRVYDKPGHAIPHYLNEIGNKLASNLPEAPYTEIIVPVDTTNEPKATFLKQLGINYQMYKDRINGHRMEVVIMEPQEQFKPRILLPEEITNTTASPGIYLSIPDPEDRKGNNWTYIGNNPQVAHANGCHINIGMGDYNIGFGAGWLKPNPSNPYGIPEEVLSKGTIYYGIIEPNSLSESATMRAEIKRNPQTNKLEMIVYSDYVGSLDDKYPPTFMFITQTGTTILKGNELAKLAQNPTQEGIIVQIANNITLKDSNIQLINQAIQQKYFETEKEKILNKIHEDIKNQISVTKDLLILIQVKTTDGYTILVAVANRDGEAEKTNADLKIMTGIESLMNHLSKDGKTIEAIDIILPGAEGSTANMIFTYQK